MSPLHRWAYAPSGSEKGRLRAAFCFFAGRVGQGERFGLPVTDALLEGPPSLRKPILCINWSQNDEMVVVGNRTRSQGGGSRR